MHPAYRGNQANTYLAQRINSASAEELAALLLGGAERFLTQGAAAIRRRDFREKARLVNRGSEIMNQLLGMLNQDADKQLVNRLRGLYVWWIKEMFEASRSDRADQIEQVVRQMSIVRSAWEELGARGASLPAAVPFPVEGLVG
ncbi:MAG: flagellar export chaperone FliS [Holophaga sp.]